MLHIQHVICGNCREARCIMLTVAYTFAIFAPFHPDPQAWGSPSQAIYLAGVADQELLEVIAATIKN